MVISLLTVLNFFKLVESKADPHFPDEAGERKRSWPT